jgi:hypothetical protein
MSRHPPCTLLLTTQLVYKWAHSRKDIANVLVEQYRLLMSTGWELDEDAIKRDVRAILGGEYEAFMDK